MEGVEEVGEGPDVDAVRAAHAAGAGVGEDSALQAGQGGDGTEPRKVAVVDPDGLLDRDSYLIRISP